MKNLFICLAFASYSANATVEIKRDFLSSDWKLPTAGASMTHYLGQECLFMEKGIALFGKEKYRDGIIEVDIADDDAYGKAGVVFRHTPDGAYNGLSFDLHALNSPKEIHASSSALMQNPTAYSTHDTNAAQWTHLKVVIQGNTAKIYLNYSDKPDSEILLQPSHKSMKGVVGLSASDGAYFSNFKFTPTFPVIAQKR